MKSSRKSQVNTGYDRDGGHARRPITQSELNQFKYIAKPGKRLRCRRPRRKSDETIIIESMAVVRRYPHIVVLEYKGECGRVFKTSMTWAEAVIQN